eukprot:UN06197
MLTVLESLYLEVPGITGNVKDFSNLNEMKNICFKDLDKVVGELSDFLYFFKLEKITIFESQSISGNLQSVIEMGNLTSFILDDANIDGKIDNFEECCPNLRTLILTKNEEIRGDLKHLCNKPYLNTVKIYETNVRGSIPSCWGNNVFTRLVLDSNEIEGRMPYLRADYFSASINEISCKLPDADINSAYLLPGNLFPEPVPLWTRSDVAQVP